MTATVLTITTRGEDETCRLARRLAERLQPGDVVALIGPLGAGKTCFVRGLASGLGIDPAEVSSPTFVLCQEYETSGAGGCRLVHLDGYRMTGPSDLDSVGWDEMLAARRAVIAVEWADRFADRLPPEGVTVEIAHVDEHTRTLTIGIPPALAARLDLGGNPAPCPICRTPTVPASPTFPFCSSRCGLVDLGRWLGEGYRISRPIVDEDGG